MNEKSYNPLSNQNYFDPEEEIDEEPPEAELTKLEDSNFNN